MAKHKTLAVAKNMFGDEQYQQRAKVALPLLVRQAWQQKPMFYQSLADEMGMPNARNLNYVLGSVGTTLEELGAKWGEKIPPIQSLVVNQASGQPGPGFFGGLDEYNLLTRSQRESRYLKQWDAVFDYPKWLQVLDALGLERPKVDLAIIDQAVEFEAGGESEAHRQLKEAIAADPTLVGLPAATTCLGTEYRLPSGDCVDVMLEHRQTQFAVEVKSAISPAADIARGIFQCVKYQAVLSAWRTYQQQDSDIQVLLALGGAFPAELLPLKNAMHLTVVDEIQSK